MGQFVLVCYYIVMIFKQLFDNKSSTYTYLISSGKGREALIIDPVLENVNNYIKLLKELELKLVKVIDTHIHADHVTGASKLKNITKCSTIMGENTPAESVEIKVKDDEYIDLEDIKIKAIYTPGHTSDSYSFLMKNHLFSGDTLLINGTGRTDFQNGNAKDSYNSIFNKLLKLPEETLLYPAHDYKGEKVSTIGKEKKQNPRLQVNSVDEYIDIMNNLELKKPTELETNVARNIKLGIDI
jgi:sulfur dioxygenase